MFGNEMLQMLVIDNVFYNLELRFRRTEKSAVLDESTHPNLQNKHNEKERSKTFTKRNEKERSKQKTYLNH